MYKVFNKLKEKVIFRLYKLIEFIEKYEYRNIILDQNDINKKILSSYKLQNIRIMSDTGYESSNNMYKTQPYDVYKITLSNGYFLECADKHILFNENLSEVFLEDLKKGDLLYTNNGISDIIEIKKMGYKLSMFDLTIDSPNHRFYTNGILSHNTVCSSITLLHFVLFNNNKNALVTANILDTAIEVLDKIREIYERLPFFLQQGIKNINQKTIVFENKSRIKGFATTKTSSIGQAADFLYLDEFAHLPDNIADKFYKSIFPTMANIENSRIIITSTPNGFNLFHKLLMDAEKPAAEKSSYTAKRVYWYQVPKRHVTYLRLDRERLAENGITKEELLEFCIEKWPDNKPELTYNEDLRKWNISIYNNPDCTEDDIIRTSFNDIKLPAVCDITTWKKETIKDIGGEEAFNQEFDLRFINESRSLLDETLLEELRECEREFEYLHIDELSDKLKINYTDLKWNTDLYDSSLRKTYKIIISVDISEGLGQDYSVINIFKISPKSIEVIEKNFYKYKSIIDFYQLEQIGIYKNNLVSVQELAEILYLITFEHFNPDNVKIVLEINQYGGELLSHLPHLFDGNNEYGSSVFFKYKHRIDADEEKIGLKVSGNKNLLVKEYQDRMKDRCIRVTNTENINELTTFIKHTTTRGNVVYRADGSSKDDMVMTVVNIASIFEKSYYRQIIEEVHDKLNDSFVKKRIDEIQNNIESESSTISYSQLSNIRQRMAFNKNMYEAKKMWGR